jgi:hypothetical protein
MTKICTKCHIEKDTNEFHKTKKHNDGYIYHCKTCVSEQWKGYYKNNADKIKIKSKTYRENNPEKIKAIQKEYGKNNPEKFRAYRKNNSNKLKKQNKEWRENNPEKRKEYIKNHKQANPEFKLLENLRDRLRKALNGNYKSGHTVDMLGCSISDLKSYLGITDCYDGRKQHIDHIIPCSLYDLSVPLEQYKCFNWRNLRLISATENLSKNDFLDTGLIKELNIEDLLPRYYMEVSS